MGVILQHTHLQVGHISYLKKSFIIRASLQEGDIINTWIEGEYFVNKFITHKKVTGSLGKEVNVVVGVCLPRSKWQLSRHLVHFLEL